MKISDKSRNIYVRTTRQLIDAVQLRARTLGMNPDLLQIPGVIALRSRMLKTASTRMDLSAMRWSIRNIDMDGGLARWSGIPDAPEWTAVGPDVIARLSREMELSAKDMFDLGGEIAINDIRNVKSGNPEMGDEEILEMVSGVKPKNSVRLPQKRLREVGLRALMAIEVHLSHADPVAAILSVQDGRQLEIDGLTRIFATAIWMSGMRPVELWDARLMIPRFDLAHSLEMQEIARKDPGAAIANRWLVPVERARLAITESFGDIVDRAVKQSGAPAILAIRTAKTTNANADVSEGFRLQVFGRIDPRMMTMLAASTQLRHFRVAPERRDTIRSLVLRRLKRIGREEPSLADLNLNLYALRHSFATRVKRKYGAAEAAALTGHSSVKSLYAYGRFRGGGKTSGGVALEEMLPAPDPVAVQRLSVSRDTDSPEPGEAA